MSETSCFVHQIFFDDSSRKMLSPSLIPLDNSTSERPDWFEFWPIRQYLKNTALKEDSWYGFLSPKFKAKVGFDGADVVEILGQIGQAEDVVLISPHWDQIGYFLNGFEQGEFWTRGLIDTCQRFVERAGLAMDLSTLVASSRSTVFSNYFVAKPVFWRLWLGLADLLVECSERPGGALADALNRPTSYVSGSVVVRMKVFVQERLACLLLAQHSFRVGVLDISDHAHVDGLFWSDETVRPALQRCAALKQQYIDSGDGACMDEYWAIRQSIRTYRPVPLLDRRLPSRGPATGLTSPAPD